MFSAGDPPTPPSETLHIILEVKQEIFGHCSPLEYTFIRITSGINHYKTIHRQNQMIIRFELLDSPRQSKLNYSLLQQ